jgi:hypothetical protein
VPDWGTRSGTTRLGSHVGIPPSPNLCSIARMTDDSPAPIVILARLDAVIEQGLASAWAGRVDVRISRARDRALFDEVSSSGARALIVAPGEMADLCHRMPTDVLILGLSSSQRDLTVYEAGKIYELTDATTETLATLIFRGMRKLRY